MNRSTIAKQLNAGICEIQYINTDTGDKDTVSVTMRGHNVKDECIDDWIDVQQKAGCIIVWSMVKEDWISIPIENIVFFEQLTGEKK
jgi:hypothetical protein